MRDNLWIFGFCLKRNLCEKEGLKVETIHYQNEHKFSKFLTAIGLTTFGAEHVIAMVSKKSQT